MDEFFKVLKNFPFVFIGIGILLILMPSSEPPEGISLIAVGVVWLVRKILRFFDRMQMTVIPTILVSLGLLGWGQYSGVSGLDTGAILFMAVGAIGVVWIVINILRPRKPIENASYTGKDGYDRAASSSSYNDSGLSYAAQGDYDSAITAYTEAIRLNPNEAVYSNRGVAYTYKGDYDLAIADHTEAIRLDPKNAASYSNRGMTYYQKGDMNSAIVDFEASLQINPNDTGTKTFLERARNQQGD